MSETDDKAFDEYLGRNSEVSRRYRELSADDVPAALNERVLAQARAAAADKAATRSKMRALRRWSMPLALAASIGFVAILVLDTEMQERAVTSMPAAERADFEAVAPAPPTQPAEAKRENDGVVVLEDYRQRGEPAPTALNLEIPAPRRTFGGVASPPAPAPLTLSDETAEELQARAEPSVADRGAPAAAAAPVSPEERSAQAVEAGSGQELSKSVVEGNLRRRISPSPATSGSRAPAAPGLQNSAASADRIVRPAWEYDPNLWLEHIRELRRQFRGERADREWTRFQQAYPDFKVDPKDEARPFRQ